VLKLEIPAPDGATLVRDADQALELVGAIIIDSPDMKKLAGDELRQLSAKSRQLEEQRKSLKEPALEMGRRVDALFKPAQERLDEAIALLKGAILSYDREAQRHAAAEQARLDEAVRLERERLLREAEEREQQAAIAPASDDDAKAELHAAAEAARTAAMVITAPVVQTESPKVAGLSTRRTWKAEVIDSRQLIAAVAAPYLLEQSGGDAAALLELVKKLAQAHVTPSVLAPDAKALGQLARALKDEMNYPGVRVYAEDSLAARAA
jgi:hypothetical protein